MEMKRIPVVILGSMMGKWESHDIATFRFLDRGPRTLVSRGM